MKSYIACIQKLSEIVNETTMNEKEKFLACPSLRMFEAGDFKFLSGEDLSPQDFLKSEDLSLQLDSLSNETNFWDVDPNNNLFEKFKNKINQLKTKSKSSLKLDIENDLKLLYNTDESETELLESYNEKLMEYEEFIANYEEVLEEYEDDLTDNEKQLINQKLDVISKQIALQFARWELNSVKSSVEAILEKVNHLNDYDLFLGKLKEIKSALRNSELTGMQSNNAYNKLHIIPFDFYENDNTWSSVEVTNAEFDGLFKKAKQSLKGFNESILEFDYKEDFIERIKLNYCIVNIKRNWLVSSVFDSEYVQKKRTTPSTYAKKVILVKDLRVILKEDLTEVEKVEIEKNSVMKFGPIFMKNQFFKNKVSKEAFIKPITSRKLVKNKRFKKTDVKIAAKSPTLVMNPKLMMVNTKARRVVSNPQKPKGRTAKPLNTRTRARVITSKPTAKKQPILLTSKTAMIHKIDWSKFKKNKAKASTLHFDVKDKRSNEEVYKAEISIQSRNTNMFKEIETDENGKITTTLPKGSYDVSIRKNGYEEISFIQAVQENKNVNIAKKMEPQEVVYDSYFLMGIIGETINL